MSLEELKSEICKLPLVDQRRVLEFVENLIEDREQISDDFRKEIEEGLAAIAVGRSRMRKPE